MKFLSATDKLRLYSLAMKNLSYIAGNRGLAPPITMWRLTKRCNLHCKQCSYHLNRDKIDQEKLVSVAHKIARSRTPIVLITGGEPMIVPNIREILTILKKAGKKVLINTNGYNLHEFHDFILEQEIDYLAVSFDGADAATHDHIRGKAGSFDRAMSSLKFFRENRKDKSPWLAVRAVVMKDNFEQMADYADYFAQYVDEVKFQPVHDYKGYDEVVDKDVLFSAEQKELEQSFTAAMEELMDTDKSFDNYYYRNFSKFLFHPKEMESIAVNHCLPVWFIFMCVLEDGSCTTCAQKIGDIYESELDDIWNGSMRIDFLTALSHHGKCKIPCWLTCTGAGQSWQGGLIKTLLRRRGLSEEARLTFEQTPNYNGILETEPFLEV